jgi:hypothetical protein
MIQYGCAAAVFSTEKDVHPEWRRDWPYETTATILLQKRCQFQRDCSRKMMQTRISSSFDEGIFY